MVKRSLVDHAILIMLCSKFGSSCCKTILVPHCGESCTLHIVLRIALISIMDTSGIWWLILGTATGTVTSVILYCVGDMCRSVKSDVRDFTFQYLAKHFDISSNTFKNLSNMGTLPRLLEQIGLRTYEYIINIFKTFLRIC